MTNDAETSQQPVRLREASSRIEIRLDELLAARKRTRYWLSQRTGISENQLHRIARMKTGAIKFETLQKICNMLDCEPGELIVRVTDEPKAKRSK